jgi:hypothetical protein
MHDVTNAALCSLRKLALGVIVGALLSSFAAAQTPAGYPNKPVRIVVPYARRHCRCHHAHGCG